MTPRKNVTQAEIALQAKVSTAAVSAVLSGNDSGTLKVSAGTRKRILAIAEELGYVARVPSSRRGAKVRRKSILLVKELANRVTNEPWVEHAYDSLLGKIAETLGSELNRLGYNLSIYHLNHEKQDLVQWLAGSDVCGVVWHASLQHEGLQWVAANYPLVGLNRFWKSTTRFDTVSVNQGMNIVLAAEYLWSLGHRKIATFGHLATNSLTIVRLAAYREFVRSRGIRDYEEFQCIPDDAAIPAMEKARQILDTWQALGTEAPTAIIMGDVFALPILNLARERGIAIPQDLSIVGVDNTPIAALMEPQLTSIDQPFEEMCRTAISLLLERIADPQRSSRFVQIAPTLVERHSVFSLKNTAAPRRSTRTLTLSKTTP